MKTLTALTSVGTVLVSGWMTLMYFVLRHPGYLWRAAVSTAVCLGAATLLTGRVAAPLRVPMVIWGAALAAFGIWALAAPADDGWVLVAGSVFVIEGVLAVWSSVRPRVA